MTNLLNLTHTTAVELRGELLSATSEALARLRVSDLTAAAPCGPSLFEHTGFCKQGGSRPRYESGATGIGKLENGSRPEAIREIARLRRSLPEPGPENRAAISIRSARPPIITVIDGSHAAPGAPPRRAGQRPVFSCVQKNTPASRFAKQISLRLPSAVGPEAAAKIVRCAQACVSLPGVAARRSR